MLVTVVKIESRSFSSAEEHNIQLELKIPRYYNKRILMIYMWFTGINNKLANFYQKMHDAIFSETWNAIPGVCYVKKV
jgi:hypothetical protein